MIVPGRVVAHEARGASCGCCGAVVRLAPPRGARLVLAPPPLSLSLPFRLLPTTVQRSSCSAAARRADTAVEAAASDDTAAGPTPLEDGASAALVAALVDECGLSRATAQRVAARFKRAAASAAARSSGMSSSGNGDGGDDATGGNATAAADAQLLRRVADAQRALGRREADRALRAYPGLLSLGAAPGEALRARLEMWEDALPDLPPGRLRARLLAAPQLLGARPEAAVPGLFEMAVVAGVPRARWADWAARSLKLALMRPAEFEARLERALVLLNDGPEAALAALAAARAEERRQRRVIQRQRGRRRTGGGTSSSDDLDDEEEDADEVDVAATPVAAAVASPPLDPTTAAPFTAASAVPPFTMADVRMAARRDFRWLQLREELLAARLVALQRALGVPWADAARAFLRCPPLVAYRPERVAARAARAARLEGVGEARARAALCALPSLLGCDSSELEARWASLRALAAAHPPWGAQLAAAAPATLASLLARPRRSHARLAFCLERGALPARGASLKGLLDLKAAAFEARAPGFGAWQAARAETVDAAEADAAR